MLFNKEEEGLIVQSIREAEQGTSGEVRIFVEDFCMRDHPVERATEVFHLFGMYNTKNRNAVLLYLAPQSRQFAFWGDVGIHEKVGFQFWDAEKQLLREHLQRDEAAAGVCQVILKIGKRLREYFPSDDHNDNELPDDIIYG